MTVFRIGHSVRVTNEELDRIFGDFVVDAQCFVNASPEAVWAVVSDVRRIGEFSPECIRVEVVDGPEPPDVGARFRGTNRWTSETAASGAARTCRFRLVVRVDAAMRGRSQRSPTRVCVCCWGPFRWLAVHGVVLRDRTERERCDPPRADAALPVRAQREPHRGRQASGPSAANRRGTSSSAASRPQTNDQQNADGDRAERRISAEFAGAQMGGDLVAAGLDATACA